MAGALARIATAARSLIPGSRTRDATLSGQLRFTDTWFQQGWSPLPRHTSSLAFPAVYASIDTISSDIARLPIRHWRIESDAPRKLTELTNSAAVRVLTRPNDYQTGFDLIKGLVTAQLFRGNGYLYGRPNGRNEFEELHQIVSDLVVILRSGSEVFYQVSAEPLIGLKLMSVLPSRVVMNHRMFCLHDPLYGITPILAAAMSAATGLSILRSTEAFFRRMARPSGVLQTAQRIDPARAEAIKERWSRVFQGAEQAGDTAVLEEGLEWKPLTMTAVDAQLIEQLRYSVEDVARVYRLPLFMLGDLTKVSFSSSEQLTRVYYSGCLSAHISALEIRLTNFFGMNPREEFLQFDLDELFRTEMKSRIESLTRSITGGLRTPNEARAIEGLNPIEGGDDVFMQQQMVPAKLLASRTDLAGGFGGGGGRPPVNAAMDDVSRDITDGLLAQLGFGTDGELEEADSNEIRAGLMAELGLDIEDPA